MNSPLVSIIIPCYNHGKFLKEAIESALAQTYPSIEIIVVNDGSMDNTSEVAKSFGSKVVLIEQTNSGLSASRNKGIVVSKGEVLSFLDADDVMLPTCIEDRIQAMLQNPNVGIVAGAYLQTDEHLQPLPENRQAPFTRPKTDRITAFHFANSANIGLLVRRRVFELCGYYDPFLKACEDWDLQLRAIRQFDHVYIEEYGAKYRQLQGSMSRDSIQMYDNARKVLRKNLIYSDGTLRYRIAALVGLYNHATGNVFSPLRVDFSGADRLKKFAILFAKRPTSILFFAALAGRFFKNRFLGRNPDNRSSA